MIIVIAHLSVGQEFSHLKYLPPTSNNMKEYQNYVKRSQTQTPVQFHVTGILGTAKLIYDRKYNSCLRTWVRGNLSARGHNLALRGDRNVLNLGWVVFIQVYTFAKAL